MDSISPLPSSLMQTQFVQRQQPKEKRQDSQQQQKTQKQLEKDTVEFDESAELSSEIPAVLPVLLVDQSDAPPRLDLTA